MGGGHLVLGRGSGCDCPTVGGAQGPPQLSPSSGGRRCPWKRVELGFLGRGPGPAGTARAGRDVALSVLAGRTGTGPCSGPARGRRSVSVFSGSEAGERLSKPGIRLDARPFP